VPPVDVPPAPPETLVVPPADFPATPPAALVVPPAGFPPVPPAPPLPPAPPAPLSPPVLLPPAWPPEPRPPDPAALAPPAPACPLPPELLAPPAPAIPPAPPPPLDAPPTAEDPVWFPPLPPGDWFPEEPLHPRAAPAESKRTPSRTQCGNCGAFLEGQMYIMAPCTRRVRFATGRVPVIPGVCGKAVPSKHSVSLAQQQSSFAWANATKCTMAQTLCPIAGS